MPPIVSSPRRALELKQLPSNSQHSCCAYGNIVLTRSLCAPDAAYLADWVNALVELGREYPEGLGALVMIDEHAHPPNDVERIEIRDAYAAVGHTLRGAVQIVEGTGFAAAAKRGALMLINMSGNMGFPIKVAGSVAEASPMLAKLLGASMDTRIQAEELTRIADDLRRRLSPT